MKALRLRASNSNFISSEDIFKANEGFLIFLAVAKQEKRSLIALLKRELAKKKNACQSLEGHIPNLRHIQFKTINTLSKNSLSNRLMLSGGKL